MRPISVLAIAATSLTAVVTLATGASASARHTYYVSPAGHDAGAGTSAHPWRSVQYAVNHAAAGSVVHVAAGRYGAFSVRRPELTIVGAGQGRTLITGNPHSHDVITIQAVHTHLSSLSAVDCHAGTVANNGYENGGSSGIGVFGGSGGTTIDHVTVTSRPSRNQYGATFGCFAISVRNTNGVRITNSVLTQSGFGVFVKGGARNMVISGNSVHDNHLMIRNTPMAGDDFGGVGIGFMDVSARPGPLAIHNRIFDNVARSIDYGTDGGAFEIYDAARVHMVANTITNNENILETGGAGGRTCPGNVFRSNTATGRVAGSTLPHSVGIIVRCARHMSITNNTFRGLTWWTFDVDPLLGQARMTRGLTIASNHVVQNYDMVYSIDRKPGPNDYRFLGNSYSFRGDFAKDWTGRMFRTAVAFHSLLSR